MKYFLNFSVAFLALGALAGCNMYSAGSINENPIRVSEEMVTKDILISDVDDAFIGSIARDYTKYGGSPMKLVITYDPKSPSNTAMGATSKVSDIVSNLRYYGVTNVDAGILPVKSQGSNSKLIISYNAFNSHAPEGCDVLMPGINGDLNGRDSNAGYKMGCSIDAMLARQVAKPSHLLGRGSSGQGHDGRSATNIVDGYRAGAQNESLDGMSASDD